MKGKKEIYECASSECRVLLWNGSFHVIVQMRKNSDREYRSFSYVWYRFDLVKNGPLY